MAASPNDDTFNEDIAEDQEVEQIVQKKQIDDGGEADFFITKKEPMKQTITEKQLRRRKKDYLLDTELLVRNQHSIISPSVQLEYKKSEMDRIQDQLDKQRFNMQESEGKWKEKESILDKKKHQFLQKIDDMSRFTKRTKSKIDKFEKKMVEEKKQKESKIEEVDQTSKEITGLEKRKNYLEVEVESLKPYQNFLEDVCRVETSFSDIDVVMKRCETLLNNINNLSINIERNKQLAAECSHVMKKEQKEDQNRIYELNSQYSELKHEAEVRRNKRKTEELEILAAEQKSIRESRQVSQIMMSINNLYNRCQDTKKFFTPVEVPTDPDEAALAHLEIICRRIQDLDALEKVAKQQGLIQ